VIGTILLFFVVWIFGAILGMAYSRYQHNKYLIGINAILEEVVEKVKEAKEEYNDS